MSPPPPAVQLTERREPEHIACDSSFSLFMPEFVVEIQSFSSALRSGISLHDR